MRRLLLLIAAVSFVAANASAAPAATYRKCSGIPSNGVLDLRSKNLPCASARAVAQRTLFVKCFLNEPTCEHGFRGRTWICTVSETFESVSCVTANRNVRWRNPT